MRYGIYLISEEWLVTQERWNLNEVTEVILILSLGKMCPVYHSFFIHLVSGIILGTTKCSWFFVLYFMNRKLLKQLKKQLQRDHLPCKSKVRLLYIS